MRHFDAWIVRDPYSIWNYYTTGRRWPDTVRSLIAERKICSPTPGTNPVNFYATSIDSQESCSLLSRLPPEIRRIIWAYVFGADAIHLVQVKNKIRHVRCKDTDPSITQHRHCCPLTPARWRIYDGRIPGHSDRLIYPHTHEHLPDNLSNGNAALLRTCWTIYTESADLLYHNSVFDVDDLYTFIAFTKIIGSRHRASIRRLTVQWMPVWQPLTGQDHKGSIYAHTHSDALWKSFWACVASLPALQELKLSLDLGRFTLISDSGGGAVVAGQRLPLLLAEPWLLPLLNVRGLHHFDLAVTARCDEAAKGVIQDKMVRDAGVLRGQLRAVICSPREVPLAEVLDFSFDPCTSEAFTENVAVRRAPLAIAMA
ncbi:hypothetical protein N7495_005524 [Penicillium taxi]|uniref:uncharacterized protein n=1 Tax=Penicillium taxi TaxID=168475 RepID=UPI002544EE2C|nr:uncharacterized protein N7495_005524 [Penicillium taxi]KAJ5893833.1 hypothetical protein N7495_005524 [Penicillium taxi]